MAFALQLKRRANSAGNGNGSGTGTAHSPIESVVSLDDVSGWVESAGFPLTRVAPYSSWLSRFRAALEQLDSGARRLSPLPVLELWATPIAGMGSVDSSQFVQRYASLIGTEGNNTLPQPTEAYVHRYVRDLEMELARHGTKL